MSLLTVKRLLPILSDMAENGCADYVIGVSCEDRNFWQEVSGHEVIHETEEESGRLDLFFQ
jgi:hypothetical protein